MGDATIISTMRRDDEKTYQKFCRLPYEGKRFVLDELQSEENAQLAFNLDVPIAIKKWKKEQRKKKAKN